MSSKTSFQEAIQLLPKSHCIGVILGNREDTSRLLAVFERNRTVAADSDHSAHPRNLVEGAALCACLSSLSQNMPNLQRLECSECDALHVLEGVRAFQPALQSNRTLRELILTFFFVDLEMMAFASLMLDALSGNTTMADALNIRYNGITSTGLPQITTLLELTRLNKIDLEHNGGIFSDEASTLALCPCPIKARVFF